MPHPREKDKSIENKSEVKKIRRYHTDRRVRVGEPKASRNGRIKVSETREDREIPEGPEKLRHKILRLNRKGRGKRTAVKPTVQPEVLQFPVIGLAEPVKKTRLTHQADHGVSLIKPAVLKVDTIAIPDELLQGYSLEETSSGLVVATATPHITPDADHKPNGINTAPKDPTEGPLAKYALGERKSRLTVLSETPRAKIKVYPEEAMPAPEEETSPGKEPIVPLHVWEATPVTALRKLATDTVCPRMTKLLDPSATPNTLYSYDRNQAKALLTDTEMFLKAAVADTAPLLSDHESQSTILSNLTGLVDRVRDTTHTEQLDAPSFVEEVVRTTADIRVTPAFVDFLSRFEIPPSLHGEVLQTLDNSGQLSQPLGWQLLDSLPEEHPFRKSHPDRVKLLSTLASPPTFLETDPSQRKDYSAEFLQETDSFLSTTISESAKYLQEPGGQEYIFGRLSAPADHARFATRKIQLASHGAVTEALKAAEGKHITTAYLDYLYHFEIPPQQAGEILEAMDKTGNLHHPIAWSLLDTLPSDHPFKEKQRRRVMILTGLLTGPTLSEETKSAAWRIAQSVISIYPDPDLEADRDKVGLEFENIPGINGITVPQGTTMGQDLAVDSVPELRLDNNEAVLLYGKAWRMRYDQIHRWAKTAQAGGASLHIHINRSEATDPEVYRMLFGFKPTMVIENDIGTVEIKGTSLADIKDKKGFSTEFMPELVDLLYSLRRAKLTPNGVSSGAKDRFDFFIHAIEDPTSRAAMLLALRTEAGMLVQNPQNISGKITEKDSIILNGLSRNFTALDASLQRELLAQVTHGPFEFAMSEIYENIISQGGNFDFLDDPMRQEIIDAGDRKRRKGTLDISEQRNLLKEAMDTQDGRVINRFGGRYETLDPAIQREFKEWAIRSRNIDAIRQFSYIPGSLPASDLAQVINIAFESGNRRVIETFGENAGDMDPTGQDIYTALAIKSGNIGAIQALGVRYGSLHPSVQETFKQWTIETKNPSALLGLTGNPKKLDAAFQEWLVDTAYQTQIQGAINSLGINIAVLGAEVQELYREKAIETNSDRAIHWLNSYIGWLNDSTQEKQVNWFMQTCEPYEARELDSSFNRLSDPLRLKIATWLLNSHDREAKNFLSDNIGVLDVSIQRWVLPQYLDEYSAERIIGHYDKLDASLKPRVLAAYRNSHPLFYKAHSCNLPGWTYPALK